MAVTMRYYLECVSFKANYVKVIEARSILSATKM